MRLAALDDLLRRSDFVSLHLTLTQQTRKMIGASELSLMTRDACLINTARGEVVDETALTDAPRERRIAGAVLDNFVVELLPEDSPLREFDNVVHAPHLVGMPPMPSRPWYRRASGTSPEYFAASRRYSAGIRRHSALARAPCADGRLNAAEVRVLRLVRLNKGGAMMMRFKYDRIRGAAVAALGLAAVLTTGLASAQAWPNKPVRLIVPYPAGGLTDVLARGISVEIVKSWGQPLLVENRPGASQMIGAQVLAQAAPDGYTIAMLDKTPLALNPFLFSKVPYNPEKDFAPVINMVQTATVLVATPGFAANTVQELIALAKAGPGSINYGTFGPGTITHLETEDFSTQVGIKLNHVPYKGIAEVLPAVASGQIQIALSGVPPLLPLYRQGRLKALAITSSRRSLLLPNVPTFKELGINLVSYSWFALFAPGATPRAVIDRIAADVGKIISTREFDEKFVTGAGLELINQGPDELAAAVAADRVKFQRYVKAVGVKLD